MASTENIRCAQYGHWPQCVRRGRGAAGAGRLSCHPPAGPPPPHRLPASCSVYVRVRPLNDQERERGQAWRVENNSVFQVDPGGGARSSDTTYTLDAIFDGTQSTQQVYECAAQGLIEQVINGFNSTVFAYGQTSSGKTHTMKGSGEQAGIIPLAVREIFGRINQTQDREFLVRVSYMEVGAELGLGWGGMGWAVAAAAPPFVFLSSLPAVASCP